MDTSASPNHKKIITPSTLARLITENPLALPLRFDEPLKVRKKWAKVGANSFLSSTKREFRIKEILHKYEKSVHGLSYLPFERA